MHLIIAAVAALACQDADLKPLCEVAKRLDEGMKLFLSGKDMKESFKNWDIGQTSDLVVTKLRQDLAKERVAEARTFAVELRLLFFRGGAAVYEIHSLIHVTPTETGILTVQGRPSRGPGHTGMAPEKLDKEAKAFGDAGKALLALLQTKKADELPWVNLKKMEPLVPSRYLGMFRKVQEKAKKDAAGLMDALKDLEYDEMKVMLDEQYFSALGPDGSSREGCIRGKLGLSEEGQPTFRLSRYEVN